MDDIFSFNDQRFDSPLNTVKFLRDKLVKVNNVVEHLTSRVTLLEHKLIVQQNDIDDNNTRIRNLELGRNLLLLHALDKISKTDFLSAIEMMKSPDKENHEVISNVLINLTREHLNGTIKGETNT